NDLICFAYRQNLTLREAGFRVLAARAQLGIAIGELFPQFQDATASFTQTALSRETASGTQSLGRPFFPTWQYGFGLAWELDFWGRFRRAIESANDSLDASVEDYDDVLVTLLSDVATNYVQMRTTEQRIKYARANVALQEKSKRAVQARVEAKIVDRTSLDQAEG